MSLENKIYELTNRRTQIELGGGEAAIKKVKADNKLTARERIDALLDTNTFVEIGAFVKHRATDFNMSINETPADGVITGYGAIEGQLVYVYSQDSTVMSGSLGEMHAKKIVHLYDLSMKMGAPIVALIDTAGIRLQEATDALAGFGSIFLKQTEASGVIPQITAILGNCGGGATIVPALSDFTFMTSKNTKLFLNSPNALDDSSANFESYANADFHAAQTGLVDFICDTDAECLASIRFLLTMLPTNNWDQCLEPGSRDDLNRETVTLNDVINNGLDVKTVMATIADLNEVIEVKAAYAKTVVTAFGRLNGRTVGMIGNQTVDNDGKLSGIACEKITSFVKFCDAFNMPLITLTDVTGFKANVAEEKAGLSKAIAAMTSAFASATVPKINCILHRAFGSAYIVQNSKHIGADFVFAWPGAVISTMEATSAVKIMYSEEISASSEADSFIKNKAIEFEANQASPYQAASRGYVDDIIAPLATRKRLISALEMLFSKQVYGPDKKHGTI